MAAISGFVLLVLYCFWCGTFFKMASSTDHYYYQLVNALGSACSFDRPISSSTSSSCRIVDWDFVGRNTWILKINHALIFKDEMAAKKKINIANHIWHKKI
jgi:hypothetical protein